MYLRTCTVPAVYISIPLSTYQFQRVSCTRYVCIYTVYILLCGRYMYTNKYTTVSLSIYIISCICRSAFIQMPTVWLIHQLLSYSATKWENYIHPPHISHLNVYIYTHICAIRCVDLICRSQSQSFTEHTLFYIDTRYDGVGCVLLRIASSNCTRQPVSAFVVYTRRTVYKITRRGAVVMSSHRNTIESTNHTIDNTIQDT